jgi:hypothetical protein
MERAHRRSSDCVCPSVLSETHPCPLTYIALQKARLQVKPPRVRHGRDGRPQRSLSHFVSKSRDGQVRQYGTVCSHGDSCMQGIPTIAWAPSCMAMPERRMAPPRGGAQRRALTKVGHAVPYPMQDEGGGILGGVDQHYGPEARSQQAPCGQQQLPCAGRRQEPRQQAFLGGLLCTCIPSEQSEHMSKGSGPLIGSFCGEGSKPAHRESTGDDVPAAGFSDACSRASLFKRKPQTAGRTGRRGGKQEAGRPAQLRERPPHRWTWRCILKEVCKTA